MTALTDPISGLNYGWVLGEDNWNTGMDSTHKSVLNELKNGNIKQH